MGILNVTPDSFSDGGRHNTPEAACAYGHLMVAQGATIIDVGGESTRPGSDEVSIAEELARVLPVVSQLAAEGLAVSIDTRHAVVARACVEAGAVIINDVSGFRDQTMVDVAVNCDAGLVVMHMLGEPKGMQADPHYEDVVGEVRDYLLGQARMLEKTGIAHERICVDPGPGFGKTSEHNLALLRQTSVFVSLGYPLMAAYSRKAFIGALTGVVAADKRVAGSVVVAAYAVQRGARVLRVHDVVPTVEALRALEILECDEGQGEVVWHES
jgi:dihydropteroate synthase